MRKLFVFICIAGLCLAGAYFYLKSQQHPPPPERIPGADNGSGLSDGSGGGLGPADIRLEPGAGSGSGVPAEALRANASEALAVNGTYPADHEAGGLEDAVVKPAFHQDLARQMVAAYHPENTHPQATGRGVSLLSLKALNLRYGTEFIGLEHQSPELPAARAEVFGHVLAPVAMRAIYALYVDAFSEALFQEAMTATRAAPGPGGKAVERTLSAEEIREMLDLTAAWVRGLAGCLHSLAGMPDLQDRGGAYLEAKQAAMAANADFQAALAAYQELAVDPAAAQTPPAPDIQEELAKARLILEAKGADYQEAITRREALRGELVAAVKANDLAGGFPDGEALYAAMWVYRRVADHPDRFAAVAQAYSLLADLSARLDALGR